MNTYPGITFLRDRWGSSDELCYAICAVATADVEEFAKGAVQMMAENGLMEAGFHRKAMAIHSAISSGLVVEVGEFDRVQISTGFDIDIYRGDWHTEQKIASWSGTGYQYAVGDEHYLHEGTETEFAERLAERFGFQPLHSIVLKELAKAGWIVECRVGLDISFWPDRLLGLGWQEV